MRFPDIGDHSDGRLGIEALLTDVSKAGHPHLQDDDLMCRIQGKQIGGDVGKQVVVGPGLQGSVFLHRDGCDHFFGRGFAGASGYADEDGF